MPTDSTAAPDVDGWGIQTRWTDAQDKLRDVDPEVVSVLRAAIGPAPTGLEDHVPVVSRPGRHLDLGDVEVVCEDGDVRRVSGPLPADFPLGYHRIRLPAGGERSLIVSPGACWLPDRWRAWGWAVQLYSARSRRSWGIGDLRDLRLLREWAEATAAGFLLVNPLHAVAPTVPQEDSPYLPATRRFRNPIYLCVDEVAAEKHVDVAEWARRGVALNDDRVIDRTAVWELKREALWTLFGTGGDEPEFRSWRQEQGSSLQEFAVWSALAEENGPDWRDWEPSLQDPAGDAVRAFAARSTSRVAFHAWLQWHLSRQLRAASGDLTVLQDLPIGVAAGGADAWIWQDQLARDVAIGAPPDFFNTSGQEWGSPPLIPWQLRASGYGPFIEAIRATMADAGGLRIDHVMGLFRLWWVAPGRLPVDGAYVRYPSADLLDIVALESHRARAIVVGEDLGTVEPGVRPALADHNVLSYRLLYFEDDPPATWPRKAMAAVTTHDLPTVAGVWTGADNEDLRAYTNTSEEDIERGRASLLEHLGDVGVSLPDAGIADVLRAVYSRLGEAPSVLLSATLEDALGVERRPNLPGAEGRENWCLALPSPIEDLATSELAAQVGATLRAAVAPDGAAVRAPR
jgi:4-alpha-glucanotransferase